MTDDAKNPSLPLSTGGTIPVFAAVTILCELRAVLDLEPALFRHLLDYAEGRSSGVPREYWSAPVARVLVAEDGTVDSMLPAVLKAAYRATPEGAVLVNPLVVTTEDDRRLVDQAERDWSRDGPKIRDMLNGVRPIPRSWADRLEGKGDTPAEAAGRTRS